MAKKSPPIAPLPLHWPARMGEEDFFVGPGNAEAFAWIQRWPQEAAFLCLHGPSGSGKTHLARIWAGRHGADFCTDFAQLIPPIKKHTFMVVDGVQGPFSAHQEAALFAFYNGVREQDGRVLWTALHPPAFWPISLQDLKSRLRTIPCTAVMPPDDEVISQVLQKCFQDHDLPVAPEILAFLLQHMPRSFVAIHQAVAAIHQHLLVEKRPFTRLSVKRALAEWL